MSTIRRALDGSASREAPGRQHRPGVALGVVAGAAAAVALAADDCRSARRRAASRTIEEVGRQRTTRSGRRSARAAVPALAATRSTEATAGSPSGSRKSRRPSPISRSAPRLALLDDPLALAAPQVEPDVALVVGGVGEGAGPASSRRRAAPAARSAPAPGGPASLRRRRRAGRPETAPRSRHIAPESRVLATTVSWAAARRRGPRRASPAACRPGWC